MELNDLKRLQIMEKFDITFYGEGGNYKLEECKKMPTKKHFEETMQTLELVGVGKVNKIVIDNIK